MFPNRNSFKQGDALKPLLFNFALEYAIKRIRVNQDGLKLNGKQQLLVYVDDVNILCRSVHTIKKNIKTVLVGSKEIGLKVNADKTKYLVISRDQNAGRIHNINIGNSSFERVEEFKYMGKTLTNETSIQEETKSRLE